MGRKDLLHSLVHVEEGIINQFDEQTLAEHERQKAARLIRGGSTRYVNRSRQRCLKYSTLCHKTHP